MINLKGFCLIINFLAQKTGIVCPQWTPIDSASLFHQHWLWRPFPSARWSLSFFPLQVSLSNLWKSAIVATKRKGEKNINTRARVRQKKTFHFIFPSSAQRSRGEEKKIYQKLRGAWVVVMVWSAGERIALWILYFNGKIKTSRRKKI